MSGDCDRERAGVVLIGVGNRMRRDDGVGSVVAQRLTAAPPDGWRIIDAGVAPEAFTGPVRRWRPELLVIVDAVDMGLSPGSLRRMEPGRLGMSDGFHSHHPSLGQLCDYLAPWVGRIVVAAVQPGDVGADPDGELSEPVARAADRLAGLIAQGALETITPLE